MPAVLHTFLRQWWTHHILEEDMRYKAFFAHPATP
jgi:hemerythrin